MRWKEEGRGEEKISACLMKEERTGKTETGLKRQTENYFFHPQHSVRQMWCCFRKIQPTRNAASKRNSWPTWLQVRDEGGERKERGMSGKRHVLSEAPCLWPLPCGPRPAAPACSEAPSFPTAPPYCSHHPPHLPACPGGQQLPLSSPGTLEFLEPPQLLICNPSSQIIQ